MSGSVSDIDGLSNADPVVITGPDKVTGASVSTNGDLNVSDRSNTSGVYGVVTVTNAATAMRVGGANLANRKQLTVHNNSPIVLYWGYDASVTTSTGTPLAIGQVGTWRHGPNITVYMIAANGNRDCRVTETS